MAALIICAPLLANAKTWEESFEEAQTERACNNVFDRMEQRCNEIVSKDYFRARSECLRKGKDLLKKCVSEVQEAAEQKKEEAKEAEAKAQERAYRSQRIQRAASQSPDIVVACFNPSSTIAGFPSAPEIVVWSSLEWCKYDQHQNECYVSTSQIRGWDRSDDKWELSRITGTLTHTKQIRGEWRSVTYQCQKASEARKF
jgi:hypothetical protein